MTTKNELFLTFQKAGVLQPAEHKSIEDSRPEFRLNLGPLYQDPYLTREASLILANTVWRKEEQTLTEHKISPYAQMIVSPGREPHMLGNRVAEQVRALDAESFPGLDDPVGFVPAERGANRTMYIHKKYHGAFPNHAKVVIVTDVMATGETITKTAEIVKAYGGIPIEAIALFQRAPIEIAGFPIRVVFDDILVPLR